MRDAGQTPCTHVTDPIDRHLERVAERIAELKYTRSVLRTLADRPQEVGDRDREPRAVARRSESGAARRPARA
jgi:hypothetical protein